MEMWYGIWGASTSYDKIAAMKDVLSVEKSTRGVQSRSRSHRFLCGLIRLIRAGASFQGTAALSGPEGMPLRAYLASTQQHRARAKASQLKFIESPKFQQTHL
ncbi:hypothetical protein NQZ68_033000 [Dissostichus eleginoides]|nr:hypothetical protein NQZ68_033000 [Dissostichus eleginoides]